MNYKNLIAAVALFAPAAMFAQATFEVNGIVYTEDLSDPSKLAVMVTPKTVPGVPNGMSTYSGDIVIPSTVEHDLDTYEVTGISQMAFMCTDLESLIINEGPVNIASGGISCPDLETLSLPNSVKTIKDMYTPGLENLTLGNGVETINGWMVIGNVSKLDLPSIKKIKMMDMAGTTLKELNFGKNLKSIDQSFYHFMGDKLTIPGSCKKVTMSFLGCENLTSLIIEDGVETISNSFNGLPKLKKLVIPSSVKTLENSFVQMYGLEEVVLPSHLKDAFMKSCQRKKDDLIITVK